MKMVKIHGLGSAIWDRFLVHLSQGDWCSVSSGPPWQPLMLWDAMIILISLKNCGRQLCGQSLAALTSGSVIIIICCFSLVFDRYKSYSPYDMLESIRKEVKGDLENAFLNLGK